MAPLWLQEKSNDIIIVQREYANEEYANKGNIREVLDKSSKPWD